MKTPTPYLIKRQRRKRAKEKTCCDWGKRNQCKKKMGANKKDAALKKDKLVETLRKLKTTVGQREEGCEKQIKLK